MQRDRKEIPTPEPTAKGQNAHSPSSSQSSSLASRLSSRKRGSVLLITVVLLLILAIMGTSYLFTTRIDRITSGGDVDNSRIDTLVDGVRELATSFIVNGLFAASNVSSNNASGVIQYQYRGTLPVPAKIFLPPSVPAGGAYSVVPYNNYDIPDYQGNDTGDPWLADRVPVLDASSKPSWSAITAPMYTYTLGYLPLFESPAPPQVGGSPVPVQAQYNYAAHINLEPTVLPFNGVNYPALTDPNAHGGATTYLAGDADGDGVADCGLFRIPGAYADGLTYYAGVRIIDNNSAVNVNTAWDDQYDYSLLDKPIPPPFNTIAGQPQIFPSYFPSGVGLVQMMQGYAASAPTGDPLIPLTSYRVGPGGVLANQNVPYNDYDAARGDFGYFSLGDAIYHQLSRRLTNPGYNSATLTRYQSFGDADAVALAYHFGMANPSSYGPLNTSVSPAAPLPMTAIEKILNPYAFQNAPNFNYPNTAISGTTDGRSFPASKGAASVTNWFAANFTNSANLTAPINLRPLLVTRNGVSIQVPPNSASVPVLASAAAPNGVILPTVANCAMPPYGDRGRWSANVAYVAGDCVTCAGTTGVSPPTVPPLSMFSGVFFARQNNINMVPLTATANWARATPWSATTGYAVGDYVYLDAYNAATRVDAYEFYFANAGNTNKRPTVASAQAKPQGPWTLWQPNGLATAVKANVNTALFPELFRAYWNVMTAMDVNGNPCTPFDVAGSNGAFASLMQNIYYGSQFGAANSGSSAAANSAVSLNGTTHSEEMFRSPVRDGPFRTNPPFNKSAMVFDPYQVLQLRAAIAAVNTENLREPGRDVIARQIPLNLNVGNTATPVNVVIYGNQPQPYITEVYAQTDVNTTPAGKNGTGYVAIELYNPYPYPIQLVGGSGAGDYSWQIATMDRTLQVKTLTQIGNFDPANYPIAGSPNGVPIVPAQGYLVLENFLPAGGGQATYRPAASGLPLSGFIPGSNVTSSDGTNKDPNPASRSGSNLPALNELYVANLGAAVGKEMFLLKRRNFNGGASVGADGTYTWNDAIGNLIDWVPADSFDFSGLSLGNIAISPATAYSIHYVRPTFNWGFVHGGRYDGSAASGQYYQQGTQSELWDPTKGSDPWIAGPPTPAMTLGVSLSTGAIASNANPTASYSPNFTVQLCNPNWAGPNSSPNKGAGGAMTALPFGGYLRDGDILETPYIAAYRIETAATGQLLELNTVSMDAAFAEDTDLSDDPPAAPNNTTMYEQVGRFCPLIPSPAPTIFIDNQRTGVNQRYGWARSLFDYLTVQDPRDDYQPNSDPSVYPVAVPPSPVANSDASLTPNPAAGSGPQFGVANTDAENTESVQGKVNINTAPFQVLQALPLVVKNDGTVDTTNTPIAAKAIIAYRQAPTAPGTGGPFTSIFDLNNIIGFNTAGINNFAGSSVPAQGNVTTLTSPAGAMPITPNEFDEMYLNMTRLSNLITTRSDTFTVYIVVEGWQNAGTSTATLVNTRRAAFIIDRNTVTPASRAVRTVNVPNN